MREEENECLHPIKAAVPMKGDTMAIARAGNGIPASADKHHIFSVHTAVPSKGGCGLLCHSKKNHRLCR